MKVVNQRVLKMDSWPACGEPAFTDAVDINGMLYGRILWSPCAYARITKIDTKAAEKVPGVKAVLTYKNVPRVPHTTAGQGYPEPSPYDTYILDSKVRFVGDRVAAVAAETPEAAEAALKLIKVEYEALPAVFDTFTAMKDGAPVIHDEADAKNIPDAKHNIAARFEFMKNGEWFKDADFVIEHSQKMPYSALRHRTAQRHHKLRPFRPAGHQDFHPGPFPRASHRGPGPQAAGKKDTRDKAPHRRRLRLQAGDSA